MCNFQKHFLFAILMFCVVFIFGCGKDEPEKSSNDLPITPEIMESKTEQPQKDRKQQEPAKIETDEKKPDETLKPTGKKVVGFMLEDIDLCQAENASKLEEEGIGAVISIDNQDTIAIQEIQVKKLEDDFKIVPTELKPAIHKISSDKWLDALHTIAKKNSQIYYDKLLSEIFVFLALDKHARWENIDKVLSKCCKYGVEIIIYKISFLTKSNENNFLELRHHLPIYFAFFKTMPMPLQQLILKLEPKKDSIDEVKIIPEPSYKPFRTINRYYNYTDEEIREDIIEMLSQGWNMLGDLIQIAPMPKTPFNYVMLTLDAAISACNKMKKETEKFRKAIAFSSLNSCASDNFNDED